MFGKKADDKIAKKQAEQEVKDKAAMEKFGVDFDSYTSDDIKEKNVASKKFASQKPHISAVFAGFLKLF